MNQDNWPFFACLVACVLAAVWFVLGFELYKFEDREAMQFNQPQIKEGNWRLGRDLSWKSPTTVERHDIVRFDAPRSGQLTSRVIGVAGERFQIKDGKILIDDQEYSDPYVRSRDPEDFSPEILIPEGTVFVLNDSRKGKSAQFDSRTLGPIPLSSVLYRFPPKELEAQ